LRMRLRLLVLASLLALVVTIPVLALPQAFCKHMVSDTHLGLHWVEPADLNQDGYVDLLTAGSRSCEMAWRENDGQGTFTEHTVSDSFDAARSVYVTDLDADGDMDLVG
jgi:hypothetical protein